MKKRHLWLDMRILFMLLFLSLPFLFIGILFKHMGYPVWIVGVAAGLFFLFDYSVSVKKTLSSVDAKIITDETENGEKLLNQVETISSELNVKTPSVYIADLHGPNAFATGRKGNGHIVFSKKLLQILTEEELNAVIAHEISHLKSRDIIPLVLSQGVGYFIGILLFEISLFIVPKNKQKVDARYVLVEKIQYLFSLLSRPVSQKREYVADADSVKALGSGRPLRKALTKINQHKSSPPTATAQLCIYNKATSRFSKMFSTHPPLQKRLEKLQKKN